MESIPSEPTGPWPKVKRQVKDTIHTERDKYWLDIIKPLVFQGNLIKLIYEEINNITWRSAIFSLPKGVMKFAINAGMDTLPSFTNLKLWGKRSSDKCVRCGNKGTLHHILNNCQEMLSRYTWRHNSVLKLILEAIKSGNKDLSVYCDLEGHTIGGGTIPPNVLPTAQKTDLVLYWPQEQKIVIIELIRV